MYWPAVRALTGYRVSATPVMIAPFSTVAPLESLISTLCGTPGSLLKKWIAKSAPAGALICLVSNAVLLARRQVDHGGIRVDRCGR